MTGTVPVNGFLVGPSANERLKMSFDLWIWRSLALAAALHFIILVSWPRMHAADLAIDSTEFMQLELAPEVEIPPPPEEIARPAIPIISAELNISEDVTIDPTTVWDNAVTNLPPPPVGRTNVTDQPAFTPYEVKPELRNRPEFGRAMERSYPSMLRDAGIGGTVILWVRIDESGAVRDTRVVTSSGSDQLDQVAQDVMRSTARFSPALNRDQKVAVWIQLPVTFQAR